MKNKNWIPFYILGVFFTLISCSSDENSVTEPETETPVILAAESRADVPYGNNPQQVYDIYLPEGRSSESTKVIVLVHGGGWTGGDKTSMGGFIPLIKENHPDHAIVNINYVLATTTTPAFPNQFLDLDRVIEQLTARQDELEILPEFGLIGVSAGAHISLMYDAVYDPDDQVKMVCDIVGPTDFTDPFYAANFDIDLLISYLVDETAYPNGTNFIEVLSPALQVSTSSSPTILFYGDQDPLVPLANGQFLQSQLENAGAPNSFTVYEGGHGTWSTASYEDLVVKLSDFINTYFNI